MQPGRNFLLWTGRLALIVTTLLVGARALALAPYPRELNRQSCEVNLRYLAACKATWARETRAPRGWRVKADDLECLRGFAMPSCPSGGSYRLRRVGEDPACTFQDPASGERHLFPDDSAW